MTVPDWALPGVPMLAQASYDGSKISPQMGLSGGHHLLRNDIYGVADWWDGFTHPPFQRVIVHGSGWQWVNSR
ncbi:hypothetical protein RRF57_007849 [Xylaria bambusicola]|uniref:Uncharacterized protein n=1 Tax=Xylaria bambusicola TaxID=326684 RepID=A0AAN7Z057_9PEZI